VLRNVVEMKVRREGGKRPAGMIGHRSDRLLV
jgi:hypothetical protein